MYIYIYIYNRCWAVGLEFVLYVKLQSGDHVKAPSSLYKTPAMSRCKYQASVRQVSVKGQIVSDS